MGLRSENERIREIVEVLLKDRPNIEKARILARDLGWPDYTSIESIMAEALLRLDHMTVKNKKKIREVEL